ncbi:MAG TPA: hypothetical protein VGU46_02190 [Acidobacteriaceae bacterium]|nr:hypothetical protein [Acidobacteriaceae bacterium]
MSQPHAKPSTSQMKKHGDPLEAAHEQDRNTAGELRDAVPPADDGGHSHSAAAHLGTAKESTKPAGNLRQGSNPGALREPPQVVNRVGKQHRA